MPYISNSNNGAQKTAATRAYITTAPYGDHIYSYSTVLDGATMSYVGTLTPLGTAGVTVDTVIYDTADIVLRENGRKLYPGANPGVFSYMVGVYNELGFSGYIDPNNSLFAIFNTDLPYFQARNRVDPTTDSTSDALVQGNPVYTAGSVTAGTSVSAGTTVTAGTGITSTTGNIVASTGNISATAGSVSAGTTVTVGTKLNLPTGAAGIVGTATLNGSTTVTIVTTAVTTSSAIYLTRNLAGGTLGHFSVVSRVSGTSFTIVGQAGDTSTVNWLIIN